VLAVFGLAERAQRVERARAQVCGRIHSLWLRAPGRRLRVCDGQDIMALRLDSIECMFAMIATLQSTAEQRKICCVILQIYYEPLACKVRTEIVLTKYGQRGMVRSGFDSADTPRISMHIARTGFQLPTACDAVRSFYQTLISKAGGPTRSSFQKNLERYTYIWRFRW
jgi:hypothetical protein